MHVTELKKKDKNRKYFQVEVYSDSRSKKLKTSQETIVKKLKAKFELEGYVFLQKESSSNLSRSQRVGLYIFERKQLDISSYHDKISKVAPVQKPAKKTRLQKLTQEEEQQQTQQRNKCLTYPTQSLKSGQPAPGNTS